MFPLLGGLISGGASLLGGLFSSNTSAQNTQANIQAQQQMQNQTEQFNASQAQLNRDFQSSQSSTAYQRASQDMQSAGLNPMMMFGSGSAASTPGGSSASVSTPNMALSNNRSALQDLGAAAERGLNSAINVKAIEKMTEEIANLKQIQARTVAETGAKFAETDLTSQRKSTEEYRTRTEEAESKLRSLGIPGAEFSAREKRNLNELPDWAITARQQGGYYADTFKKGADTLSSIPGIDILKKAFREQNSSSANAVRRGMDLERNFNFNRN
jgi:hypothetical protein